MTLTALERKFEMELKKVLRKFVENHKSECKVWKGAWKCKQSLWVSGAFPIYVILFRVCCIFSRINRWLVQRYTNCWIHQRDSSQPFCLLITYNIATPLLYCIFIPVMCILYSIGVVTYWEDKKSSCRVRVYTQNVMCLSSMEHAHFLVKPFQLQEWSD